MTELKQSVHYWDEQEEQALTDYVNPLLTNLEKNKVFSTILYPAIYRMVQIIYRRYFSSNKFDSTERNLFQEVLTQTVFAIIRNYKPSETTKGFSYIQTIIKNEFLTRFGRKFGASKIESLCSSIEANIYDDNNRNTIENKISLQITNSKEPVNYQSYIERIKERVKRNSPPFVKKLAKYIIKHLIDAENLEVELNHNNFYDFLIGTNMLHSEIENGLYFLFGKESKNFLHNMEKNVRDEDKRDAKNNVSIINYYNPDWFWDVDLKKENRNDISLKSGYMYKNKRNVFLKQKELEPEVIVNKFKPKRGRPKSSQKKSFIKKNLIVAIKKVPKTKEEINAYQRDYYSKNKEKVKKYNRDKYTASTDKYKAKRLEYYANNKEKIKEQRSLQYQKKKEKNELLNPKVKKEKRVLTDKEKTANLLKCREYYNANKVELLKKSNAKYHNNKKKKEDNKTIAIMLTAFDQLLSEE